MCRPLNPGAMHGPSGERCHWPLIVSNESPHVVHAERSIVAGHVDELHDVGQGNPTGARDLLEPDLSPLERQRVPVLLVVLEEPSRRHIAQLLRQLEPCNALPPARCSLYQCLADEKDSPLIQSAPSCARRLASARHCSRQEPRSTSTSSKTGSWCGAEKNTARTRSGRIVRTEPTDTPRRQVVTKLEGARRIRQSTADADRG